MEKYVYSKHKGKIKSLVIWGRDGCPYCVRAKKLANELRDNGTITGFEFNDTNKPENNWDTIKQYINTEVGVEVKTVPQIWGLTGDGLEVYIGGFTDLYTTMPE